MANNFNVNLQAMLRKFGSVTVMDLEAYKAERDKNGNWDAIATFNTVATGEEPTVTPKEPLFKLNTLKISNINQEGPNKTATGGMNGDVLLKYGKKFTIEMQDALGSFDVLNNLYGSQLSANDQIFSMTDGFAGEITLVGKTFVIDQATGAKQKVRIGIPLFLGDSIFNYTQDAEGDIATFDMNGDILKFSIDSTESYVSVGKGVGDTVLNIYGKGGDNEFWFFSTEQGYELIKKNGYAAAKVAATPITVIP